MMLLLIDGVKYDLWIPTDEEEFEGVVCQHTQDIFGDKSAYFNIKKKLMSKGGIGSIPDGYVITLSDPAVWHIVEVELSGHDLYKHITSQVSRFISTIESSSAQTVIANAIYEEIKTDDFLKLRFKKATGYEDIHRLLSDLIAKPPVVTVIIEKYTEGLREALKQLRYQQVEVIEFQTFTRTDVGLGVHAHLFEPMFRPTIRRTSKIVGNKKGQKSLNTKSTQLQFWNKFKEYAQGRKTKLKLRKTYPQHWYDISYGGSKSNISLTINSQSNILGCEIYIPDSKDLFKKLVKQKEKIEQELGEILEWMELPDKKASRIKLSREGVIDDTDRWEEHFAWFQKKAEDFQAVFPKYIK